MDRRKANTHSKKRLPIAKQLTVGRFVLKIDSDGAVFTGRVGCSSHGHPQVRWSMQLVTKNEGNPSQFQEDPQRRRGFTTKVGGMCENLCTLVDLCAA